jgi:hypothetical protein
MIASYKFFMTPMCPNCGEIQEYLKTVKLQGKEFDATTDEGLTEARESAVMGVPTILFVDKSGKELSRATKIDEIRKVLENKSLLDV